MFRGLFETWNETKRAEKAADIEAAKNKSNRIIRPANQNIGPETKEQISDEQTALIKRPANK